MRFFIDDDLEFVFLIVPGGAFERVADLHGEPRAPGLRAQRMFDSLDDTLSPA